MGSKSLVLKKTKLEEFPDFEKNEAGEDVIAAEAIDLPRWSKTPVYDYVNLSDKYIVDFPDKIRFAQNQYNQVYQTRYAQLVDLVKKKGLASEKYKSHQFKFLSQIHDGETAFVIGIIFRKSAKRPSVLVNFDDNDEEDGEVQLTVDENPDEIITDEDWLELEDAQTQSIRLSCIQLSDFATGMVVGLFGTKVNSNDFKVSDVILPGPPIDRSLRPVLDDDCYIVFLSGISANRENSFDWHLRFRNLRVALSRPPFHGKLDRLIICGNLSVDFCDCSKCASISMDDVKHLGATKDPAKNQAYITILDKMTQYFRTIQFDLMPGDEDPTSAMWPQDPINDSLIKNFVFDEDNEAHMLESEYEPPESDDEDLYASIGGPVPLRVRAKVNSVPNPYQFETRGFRFLGSCGENVHNLRRMSNPKEHNELIMEKLLDLCHVCPTAPQAPDCYPFDSKKVDPFVIEQMPHVFFAGNQDGAFSYTRQYPGNDKTDGKPVPVQFVGIPRSKHTMAAYALNLRTMQLDAINLKNFNVMRRKKTKPKKK